MSLSRKRIVFGVGFVFLAVSVPSAASGSPALWLDAGVEYKPGADLKVEVAEHVRIQESLTELESYKTDLGLNWRPTRWFRPGVGYRLSMKVDKYGDFNPFHRFHVQNQAKIRLGPLALSYRFRYQDQLSFEKELTEHKHTVRNRFKVKGKVPWALAPSLEVEGFTRLYETPFYALKKLRVTTGIEWQMTRQHAIHPYYRIQIPMDDPNDPIEYIVGLSYVFVIE